MKTPRVSIIIPCYNGATTLPQTIATVQWQTEPQWECILVDDGSTDSSVNLFRERTAGDSRFRLISQDNRGLAAARNRGIQEAQGEFVQLLDADDLLLPEKLQSGLKAFAMNSQDVVYSDYALLSPGGDFFRTLPARIPEEDPLRAFLFRWNTDFIIPVHAFLFRRDLLMTHGFDESMRSHAEDVDCWIRMAMAGVRFHHVPEVNVVYRQAGASTGDEDRLISAKINLLREYGQRDEVRRYSEELEREVRHLHRRLAIASFMKRDFSTGISIMKKEWGSSDPVWKLKMVGWMVLMRIFSKGTIVRLRHWIVSRTPLRWGGWRLYTAWTPPKALKDLVERREG